MRRRILAVLVVAGLALGATAKVVQKTYEELEWFDWSSLGYDIHAQSMESARSRAEIAKLPGGAGETIYWPIWARSEHQHWDLIAAIEAMGHRFLTALPDAALYAPVRARHFVHGGPDWAHGYGNGVVGPSDAANWPCRDDAATLYAGEGNSCIAIIELVDHHGRQAWTSHTYLAISDLLPLPLDGNPVAKLLAHSYHFHAVHNGFKNACIRKGYNNAVSRGLYRNVKLSHRKSGALVHRRTAYGRAAADWNEVEWFAEGAVSYFVTNDEYPFNRHDLYEYDPDAYEIQRAFWADPTIGAGRCPI